MPNCWRSPSPVPASVSAQAHGHRAWVRDVAAMGSFDRILTAHFASPIAASPSDLERTFAYLDGPTADPPIACEDWALLDGLNSAIETNKLGAPVVYDFKAGCPAAER